MNSGLLLIVAIVVLACGFVFYGGWLEKTWGVDPDRPTPAHTLEDGVDYCPAKAPVLMGHHFSSIAGAGPINGPIQAAVFGWVPVMCWILIGGVFAGGLHDFGALFASIRHDGKSMGEVIGDVMGPAAKRLFLVFGYLTLLLVVAAFAAIVASTFGNTSAAGQPITGDALDANLTTATISLLFIVMAIIFGFAVYRRGASLGVASIIGVIGIGITIVIGLNWHPFNFSYTTWMIVLGAYIMIASVTPVWILLQPRDYLSSFLLYFMLGVGIIAVIGSAATGNGHMTMPAFGGWTAVSNGLMTGGTLFPALFITIACGACSGFHSLVSSGTTSKQINNEKDARTIGYGAMLIECVVATISVCAVSFVWKDASLPIEQVQDRLAAGLTSPTAVFAKGISGMIGTFGVSAATVKVFYQMLILAVSVFCLTSLDTATRLARYMFQEFWLKEGENVKDATGTKKLLTNMYFSTAITVVIGIALGLRGYATIWPLFGAANQLLAALGLLGVCAWLGKVGKNNKMFYVPMVFMLVVTLTSLVQTIKAKIAALGAGAAALKAAGTTSGAVTLQVVIAVILVILAVILAVMAFKALTSQSAAKKQEA